MKKTEKTKSIAVLHHDDHDGFGAAWAAWKKLGNKAEYFPVQYSEKNLPPSNLKNKDIYLLDFCYDAASMRKLLKNNKKLVVIDHHITRKDESKISIERLFRINNSGAVLSWRFFHPMAKIPKLLLFVEDIDLWKMKVYKSGAIMAAVDLYPMSFRSWDKMALEMETSSGRKKYARQGETVLDYNRKMADKLIHLQATPVVFENKKSLAVNSPVLESEIGNSLVKMGAEVGIVWNIKNGGRLKVSLRSNPHKIDVSKLAERFGGGGHKSAAGFTIKFSGKSFPWKPAKNSRWAEKINLLPK